MKLKKAYTTPEIEVIKLDNEISLQLASPYSGPDEDDALTFNKSNRFDDDPYKMA